MVQSALALALTGGPPLRIERIRAARRQPTWVDAARTTRDAEVAGAKLVASGLSFRPGPLTAGRYHVAIGTTGSTLLVVQALVRHRRAGRGVPVGIAENRVPRRTRRREVAQAVRTP